MQNLAYVVNSANDNITGLQRTVKLQEKELTDKCEHAEALQRNYETLSRIRKSDQIEFVALKTLQADACTELERSRELYAAEQAKTLLLEHQLLTSATAEQQLQKMQLELSEATHQRDEYLAETEKQRRVASESKESARSLKQSLDKAARSQQEMLQRAKRAEEELKAAGVAREALEKAKLGGAAKLAVHGLVEGGLLGDATARQPGLLRRVRRAPGCSPRSRGAPEPSKSYPGPHEGMCCRPRGDVLPPSAPANA